MLLGGPVCPGCYYRLARTLKDCYSCGEPRVIAFLDEAGRKVCAACAGVDSPFACKRCGREGNPHGRRCALCVLEERTTELLSGPDGAVHPRLAPVAKAMLAVDRPLSALMWLEQSQGATILRAMAREEVPISHDGLDRLERTQAVDHLRDILVVAGVLPERDVHLERIGPWLDALLADRPAPQARVVRLFATWCVLPRVRARAASVPLSVSRGARARRSIRVAADLLIWLDDHGTDLAGLRQGLLDEWLASGRPERRVRIGLFLGWASERRLTGPLNLAPRVMTEPGEAIDAEVRWDLVERFLHDSDLRLEVRVAGLFVLLFGQQLSKVVEMTASQVIATDTKVEVRFGDTPVTMPPHLDDLVRGLLARRGRSVYAAGTRPWLFPGGAPGRPLTAGQLAGSLRSAGLDFTRPARNAAMIQLASDIPAAVLADLLGISAQRATMWAALVKHDWAGYTAARAER